VEEADGERTPAGEAAFGCREVHTGRSVARYG
jgi:hypothetical protein